MIRTKLFFLLISIGFIAFTGAYASPSAPIDESLMAHSRVATDVDVVATVNNDSEVSENDPKASVATDTDVATAMAFNGVKSSVALETASAGVFLTEKVATTQNADTVPEFFRDIESVVFVPKGQWVTGISVSYAISSQSKYQFLIFEGISGDTYSFKISPMLMYVIIPDLGVGGRFAYARSLTKVENADIVLDSETDYQVDHLYRLSHNYYFTAMARNYFSIGKSKRFGFFNELQLQMGGGQTKLTTGVGTDLTGMYERNFSLDLGLAPGICVFLNNYSALEVNIGVLGFSYTATKAIRDQIYVSRRNSKSANFRINLFSIQFGVSFYL